jgi:hypothetical protein
MTIRCSNRKVNKEGCRSGGAQPVSEGFLLHDLDTKLEEKTLLGKWENAFKAT